MNIRLFHTKGERRSQPFVLLEIGMLYTRLHYVEAAKNPVCTTLLREECPAPGEGMNLMQMVRNVLNTDTAVRDLAIVINTPAIHHQLLSIPYMRKESRQKVLQFEVKQSSSQREEQGKISFWSAGKMKEQGATREQVLCAELNQSIVDGLMAAAREKNFQLIGLTSYAQMASHLLKECPSDDGHNVALLEVSEHEGSITLFHANVWNMERHFLITSTGQSMESQTLCESDAEKLRLEIGRALQYFKQQVRNENIDCIYLFGSTRYAEDIKRLLETHFRLSVVPILRDRKRFFLSEVPEERTENLPLFQVVHIAALYSEFEHYIDFLPHDSHRDKYVKLRRLTMTGCAVASYLLMGIAAFLLNREASRIPQSFQSIAPPLLTQEQAHSFIQQTQQDRSFALATQKSDSWLRERHYLLAELVRELAIAFPPQMRAAGLEVIGKGDGWQVKIDMEIRGTDGSQSQQLLLKFQEESRTLPCLKQLTWGDVRLADTNSSDDSAYLKNPRNSLLTFTMKGVLNQQIIAGKSKPSISANPSHI
jgi:hypothetical protein